MAVYLIHFKQRYKHAGHYIGYSADLAGRIRAHRENEGARLLQVVNEAGIAWEVVRVWPNGGYELERALKARKNAPQLCPICNPALAGEVVQTWPDGRVQESQDWLEASAFAEWLRVQGEATIVGNADSLSDCPLCWWFASLYGGLWQVNAAQYRWREQEWLPWSAWQPLPPWAIVFLHRLFEDCGKSMVSAAQVREVLRGSLVDLYCWEWAQNRQVPPWVNEALALTRFL